MDPITAAYVSTFPPRQCGIATFTHDLINAISGGGARARALIVAIDDEAEGYDYDARVRWQIMQHEARSYEEVAAALSHSAVDVVNIQHEFGIFGGPWGAYLLRFLGHLHKPVVTTLHTVLSHPEPEPRRLTKELYERSEAVVVMTPAAVEILRQDYGLLDGRVSVIPHGVPAVALQETHEAKVRLGLAGRAVISTFGLINPGKGIEDVIDALPTAVERFPEILYLVLGETHPVVRRAHGEQYRDQLVAKIHRLGLDRHVTFNNRYLTDDELIQYLAATDIYISAYRNPRQIVSGTLAYAQGCGRAIISTPYLYARDALADGRGVLVPFQDPAAMATAIADLLADPSRRAELQRRSYAHGQQMGWPRVAAAYLELFRKVRIRRPGSVSSRRSMVPVAAEAWTVRSAQ